MTSAWFFAMRDVAGVLWAAALFAALLLPLGYWFGWLSNVKGFRTASLREQWAWMSVLGLAGGIWPIVALAWGVGTVAAGILLSAVCGAALLHWRRQAHWGQGIERWWLVPAAGWVALVIVSLLDWPTPGHLWMSVTSYDHAVRVEFVSAIMRDGVPPNNPLYWPLHDAPMRYYWFWYVPCAVVAKLGHVSARQAFVASCIWPPVAVAALLALLGRHLLVWRGADLLKRWRWSLALLAVTGLDLIPVMLGHHFGGELAGDMEWWSVDQVTSWVDSFLWVPHHIIAMVAATAAMLLLYQATAGGLRQSWKSLLVAALLFAGAFGASNYVGFAAAIVVTIWAVTSFASTRLSRISVAAALVGVVALALDAGYLHSLVGGATAGGGFPLGLDIRQIFQPAGLLKLPSLSRLAANHPVLAAELAAFILLPFGYVFELGFFLPALLSCLRWKGKPEGERVLMIWSLGAFAAVTFIRSHAITTNDYGIRASLLLQLPLLLLAVTLWERSRRPVRALLVTMALFGLAGSLYQVVMLRSYLPWHEMHGDDDMASLSERNYALRLAYERLDQVAPSTLKVWYQVRPDDGWFGDAQMLEAGRQIVNADAGCNSSFGGERTPCGQLQAAETALFPKEAHDAPGADVAFKVCKLGGSAALVATRWDAVWNNRASWVWRMPTLVETPDVRIIRCADSMKSASL